MNTLPQPFLERMERLLGPEFEPFLATYSEPRTHGLRANPLKLAPELLPARLGLTLEPVPWAPGGFYFPETARPGRHPYHAAGLYYIQEPSAMAAAAALAPRPGERVLDLCAAPGGKSTHLAALMHDQGLLVANEIHPKRARILVENLERMGTTCALVLNEDPQRLAPRFPAFFDRILVDAPCSGEGMFRKLPEASMEWSPASPAACGALQREIVTAAVAMLRPGGHLLYSTCTFAPEENEQTLAFLLDSFPEMELAALPPIPGAAPAVPAWAGEGAHPGIARGVRLWPHRLRGEGHFLALLRKREDAGVPAAPSPAGDRRPARQRPRNDANELEKALPVLEQFCKENLHRRFDGPFRLHGEELYQVPAGTPDLEGIKVLRPGLHLGSAKKNRFEPAHALALALKAEDARQRRDLPAGSDEVLAYLRGEAIPAAGELGWTLVTVDGFPLGWGKASDGLLKNHYPKGLRWPGAGRPAATHDE